MKTEQEIKEKIKEVNEEIGKTFDIRQIEMYKISINILLWVLD